MEILDRWELVLRRDTRVFVPVTQKGVALYAAGLLQAGVDVEIGGPDHTRMMIFDDKRYQVTPVVGLDIKGRPGYLRLDDLPTIVRFAIGLTLDENKR